ncbi:PREDICTED: secreted frizzled-related protein 1-like [Cyprinodon variegatus]|uniref:secreted frizzled-related protein 1-like n=1 Tax=Cyprinodon variegatus TaxID=28743 RepID=UPI0007429052|nr:PREDICTED: secreted frizzled-related protein 1-like [Cyprinodon variegatus]
MSPLPLLLWRMIRMLWTVALMSAYGAQEYDFMEWDPPRYNTGPIYGKTPQCLAIPEDLRLCYGVGYPQMLLPNLLEHETMAEVKQQASSWVPLVHKRCHPGTQVFLCSLFAPVCLDRPIFPCRRLCEAVRDGCTPIMEAFGYPWPEMLTCDKFPDHDVCISMTPNATESPESAAIKAKIKEVKRENTDRKVILQKRKKMVKAGNLKKKDTKKLVLYLKNGADCPCQQLDNLTNQYLIMGRKVDKQYLLTGIHKWDKSNKEFKKAMKTLKTHKCPEFTNVFK